MTNHYKDLTYVGNPGNACALACYTMVAKYFFNDLTFDDIAKISRWEPGYVVWEMPFWNFMLEQGIKVTNFDAIDYKVWSEDGIDGLKKSLPATEFEYYKKNTFDLESFSSDIKQLFQNPNFTHHKRNPTWDDLVRLHHEDAVCNVVLCANALDHKEGLDLHQVSILYVSDSEVEFHDPRGKGKEKPNRKESVEHFRYAWLERVVAPSLCAYQRVKGE